MPTLNQKNGTAAQPAPFRKSGASMAFLRNGAGNRIRQKCAETPLDREILLFVLATVFFPTATEPGFCSVAFRKFKALNRK